MMKTKSKRSPQRPATLEARLWRSLELLTELQRLNVLGPGDVVSINTIKTRLGRAWHRERQIGSSATEGKP